jgi:hypothetical protein
LSVTESAGEILVHDREQQVTHHLDPITAAIWKSCDGWRTVADLGQSCACVLGTPVSDDTAIATVARLERAGLLELPALPTVQHARPSPTDSIGGRQHDVWRPRRLGDSLMEGAG